MPQCSRGMWKSRPQAQVWEQRREPCRVGRVCCKGDGRAGKLLLEVPGKQRQRLNIAAAAQNKEQNSRGAPVHALAASVGSRCSCRLSVGTGDAGRG